MPFSSPAQTKTLAADVPVLNQKSPFLDGQPIRLLSVAGATVYGVNRPGSLDTTQYALLQPGAQNANVAITVPTALQDMDDQAAISSIERLRLIAIKNPHINGGTLLTRVASGATAGAGEFNQTDANTLKVGFALLANDRIELWVLDSGDVVTLTGGALTAARIYDSVAYDVMMATALTNVTPAGVAG